MRASNSHVSSDSTWCLSRRGSLTPSQGFRAMKRSRTAARKVVNRWLNAVSTVAGATRRCDLTAMLGPRLTCFRRAAWSRRPAGYAAKVRVDQCSRGGAVDLSSLPCQGELAEGQAAGNRIDPVAMAHCRVLLAHPSFGLGIEAKRPRPFSPVRTSVSALPARSPPLHGGHQRDSCPSCGSGVPVAAPA